jgi:putative glycosyltransferase (TIGR04372 family)
MKEFLIYLFAPLAFLLRSMGVRVVEVKYEEMGHLALVPDVYLKEQNRRRAVLFVPPGSLVSSSFLLNCWREHFFVIKNPILSWLLYPVFHSPLLRHRSDHYFFQKLPSNHKEGFGCIPIYNAFGAASVISLKEKDRERGKKRLRELGIPEGAWYVCFEENSWPALEAVIERGGWCIRMGSSGVVHHERILDYLASDFMDVFLLATCRFFIGNSSDRAKVAGIFGTPCVLHHVIPFGLLSVFPKDITIFKRPHSKITGRPIPFLESLQSYLSVSMDSRDYEEFQVELVENTPEEIRDLVIEMLDRLEGRLSYTSKEEEQQRHFQSMLNSFNFSKGASSRVGKEFLKRHSGD